MKLKEIINILGAEVVQGTLTDDRKIKAIYNSDLMSDVLAYVTPGALLLTGLTNPQVVRTAEMAEISAICFANGKVPPVETIKLATENKIPLLTTSLPMYEACGKLYKEWRSEER